MISEEKIYMPRKSTLCGKFTVYTCFDKGSYKEPWEMEETINPALMVTKGYWIVHLRVSGIYSGKQAKPGARSSQFPLSISQVCNRGAKTLIHSSRELIHVLLKSMPVDWLNSIMSIRNSSSFVQWVIFKI